MESVNKETAMENFFGEVIHSYTREEALEDGFLVDVSTVAKEAGIIFPVAMTRTVWGRYVEVPRGVEGQDEDGRLWDILWMLRVAIAGSDGGERLFFKLHVRNKPRRLSLVTLKAVCSPGDNMEPVITIMLTDED